MANTTDKKTTVSVSERNLIDVDRLGLTSGDAEALKQIVNFKPVKVDLELIMQADNELKAKAYEKQARAGVRDVVDRYESLFKKAGKEHLTALLDKWREDQAGNKKAFSEAGSILSKLCKYVEKVMEDFRVDLRENIAKRLGISAKEMMTVGHIAVKESTLKKGVFKSESSIDSGDEVDEEDLLVALKSKKWQHVGLATSSDTAKIVVNKKKAFKKEELKKSMDKLFAEKDRPGLKFYVGMIKAEGQTNLEFEFLDKSKPGKDPKTFETRLKKGLKQQMSFKGHLEIKPVEEFTEKAKPETKNKEKETEKGKEKEKTTAKTN